MVVPYVLAYLIALADEYEFADSPVNACWCHLVLTWFVFTGKQVVLILITCWVGKSKFAGCTYFFLVLMDLIRARIRLRIQTPVVFFLASLNLRPMHTPYIYNPPDLTIDCVRITFMVRHRVLRPLRGLQRHRNQARTDCFKVTKVYNFCHENGLINLTFIDLLMESTWTVVALKGIAVLLLDDRHIETGWVVLLGFLCILCI